jgi:hypothetical protein
LLVDAGAETIYPAQEKHHGHHEQTAESMAETDRLARQIISVGIEHFSFQSERLGRGNYSGQITLAKV